jgi:hypothetical protein
MADGISSSYSRNRASEDRLHRLTTIEPAQAGGTANKRTEQGGEQARGRLAKRDNSRHTDSHHVAPLPYVITSSLGWRDGALPLAQVGGGASTWR